MFRWITRLLGRGRKTSAALPLIAGPISGQAVWSSRNYATFAKEGYQQNDVTYMAVEEIAKAVASVPWRLFRKTGDSPTEIQRDDTIGSPGFILHLLSRSSPGQAGPTLIHDAIAFMLIAGNSYLEGVGPASGQNAGKFVEIYTKRPDRMRVIAGKAGPAGYEYEVNGQKTTWQYNPRTGLCSVLHLKLFHPTDDWYGLSPIEAGAYGVDLYNAYAKWNKALLDNGARPGGVLTKPEPLTEEQYRRVKEQLKEKYEGSGNAGRTLILEEGETWTADSLSPKEMDWLEGDREVARKIARALGVPPMLLGIPGDNTYSNQKEAREAFWLCTAIWYLEFLRGELNNWLCPRWANDLVLDYDLSGVPALSMRQDLQWDRQEKGSSVLTLNERRALVGYPPVPGGDVILIPATLLPLDIVAQGPSGAGGKADDEKGLFRRQLLGEGLSEDHVARLVSLAFPGGNGAMAATETPRGSDRW